MGNMSIVTGHVLLNEFISVQSVLQGMNLDKSYPFILPEMFSAGASKWPGYYESPIVSFAATYKNLEGGVDWSEFVLKFEYILSNMNFKLARVRLETEYLGEYEFFWGAKTGEASYDPFKRDDLLERDKWYFGYGIRHMYGDVLFDNEPQAAPYEFVYPVEFNDPIKTAFNKRLAELNSVKINTPIFLNVLEDEVFGDDNVYLILTYLEINGVVERSFDEHKGMCIKRLKEIKPLTTPYDNTIYQ